MAINDSSWPNRAHLLQAVATEDKTLIELIIASGVNPNEIDEDGDTVLHDVVRMGFSPKAVLAILPYMNEPNLKNRLGQTPFDLAVAASPDVVKTLEEALGAPHYWWQLPRVSDAATFLSFETPDGKDLVWLTEQVDAQDWCVVSRKSRSLRIAKLPFYDRGYLLAIEDTARRGPREQFALVRLHTDLVQLDWTNEPFYLANETWPAILDKDTICPYLRTFFHFVRGDLGQFQIADNVGQIAWEEEASAERKRSVELRLEPLTVESFEVGDRVVLTSTVMFKNALFRTKYLVSLRRQTMPGLDGETQEFTIGQTTFLDESVLLEDLPVHVPLKTSTWG